MLMWLCAVCLAVTGGTPLRAQSSGWRTAPGGLMQAGSPSGQYPVAPFPLPNFIAPRHRIDDTFGPLALLPGEVRIDGLLLSDFDSSMPQFEIRACAYAQATGSREWLPEPRDKVVLISGATRFAAFGSAESEMALRASEDNPFHVTVIGTDQGVGKPVEARVVWLDRLTGAESSFAGGAKHVDHVPDPVSPAIAVSHPFIPVDGRPFEVTVVRVRLCTVRMTVALAAGQVGATESLDGIARDHGAVAAINGSFFDAYDVGPIKKPDMELITGGQVVFQARTGTLIGFTPDGQCAMETSIVADALRNLDPAYPDDWDDFQRPDVLVWQKVTEAVGAGPRLVRDGAVALSPYAEGFSSPDVISSVTRRSAVGFTSNGVLLLVSAHANIPDLARIMKALGCAQAMNMDGGSSSGIWLRGTYLQRPGRDISNALLILPR
ncbi:MAG: phosphodiester glycosidase family protein [Capsulimonadaceae bacterium]